MNAVQLLPTLRDLYSCHPETYHLHPWELQHVLFSLGYTDDLADETEIAAAVEALGYRIERLAEFGDRRFVFLPLEGVA